MSAERAITCNDPDIESATVKWYDETEVFIDQTETVTKIKHCCLFPKAAARQLRDILNEFLGD